MTKIQLYTGNGVSLSPINAEGRTPAPYIRLVADEGRGITNGVIITTCVDVPEGDAGKWTDCDAAPDEDEITDSEALSIILGGDA